MGFSIQMFFNELYECMDQNTLATDKDILTLLKMCINENHEYAKTCGTIED